VVPDRPLDSHDRREVPWVTD